MKTITGMILSLLFLGTLAHADQIDSMKIMRSMNNLGIASHLTAVAMQAGYEPETNSFKTINVVFSPDMGPTKFRAEKLTVFEGNGKSVLVLTAEMGGSFTERVIKTQILETDSAPARVIAEVVKTNGNVSHDVSGKISRYDIKSLECRASIRREGQPTCKIEL